MPDRRIIVLGDSFVAGFGDPTGLGWVGRVVAASHDAGRPLTAYNLGVRRDTSADVAARWRSEVRTRMRDAEASYGLVLALGANDMTEEHGRLRVQPGLGAETLGELIEAARRIGLGVFVVGPPPAGELEHDERICDLSRRFADVAARCDVPFAETAAALRACPAWTREAAQNDGTHPGAGGYAALAELVLSAGWLDWVDLRV